MASEKPIDERIKECVTILKDIEGLGIPNNSPEVSLMRAHFNSYIKDGICWTGTIDFRAYGRIAEITLPRRADRAVEVRLRMPRVG